MQPEEYEFMYRLEEKFWWYVAMRHITDSVVSSEINPATTILDVGCGTGINLVHFASRSTNVFGLDISSAAIDGVRRRGYLKVTQASIAEIPYASNTFDLTVSLDVLYQFHPPLVNAGLREISRVMRPGGALFVRVPAFQWMRSSHDDAVHSVHRFTRSEIVQEIEKAGLKVEWSSYANFFLFPVVLIRRMLKSIGIGAGSDVRPLPDTIGWIDPILRRILESEASFFRARRRFPFGLSVICLARKSPG